MLGRFGCKKDTPDSRDLMLKLEPHLGMGAPLPPSAERFVGSTNPPILDQQNVGDCTANCWDTYRRWLAETFPKYSALDIPLSRRWFYDRELRLSSPSGPLADNGAQMRDGAVVLTSQGIPSEADVPYYPDGNFAYEPEIDDSPQWDADAKLYTAGAYARVADFDTAKSVLLTYPIALGFSVYESFENIGSDGKMPMPGPNEQIVGGHATCIHGFEDGSDVFVVRNSWGADWGLHGDFLMPYAFLQQQIELGQIDMWRAHLGPKWVAK